MSRESAKNRAGGGVREWFIRSIQLLLVAILLCVMPQALAQSSSSKGGKKADNKTATLAGTPAPDGGVYGRSSRKSVIRNGMLIPDMPIDTLARDTLAQDSLATYSAVADSLGVNGVASDSIARDSLAQAAGTTEAAAVGGTTPPPPSSGVSLLSSIPASQTDSEAHARNRYFSDSMSLSKVTWTAAFLPGYGQIYNKQYWKLPIFYGAMAGSLLLYLNENKKYQPLKESYDAMTLTDPQRTEELNELQAEMIRSNTRRQIYLGATIASYIYTLGDAAVNYATNDVSDVKRATTLATICPGAGQIYNKSYWKVPFVVGGFAMMAYVLDWNNRGYQRFKKAYTLRADYDVNPDDYPDGSADEFSGRYTADYLQSLRDSYRRNRDMSFIFIAGLYVLQIVDAHVDAHFKDFDVSDDLSMSIEPTFGYSYQPSQRSDCATYGFSIDLKF